MLHILKDAAVIRPGMLNSQEYFQQVKSYKHRIK